MRRIAGVLLVVTLVLGLALTGCEKKTDAEKALGGLKKDMKSMTK